MEKVNTDGPIPAGCPELGRCWLWTAGTSSGYGAFSLGHRKMVSATRWIWTHTNGPIPAKHSLCHHCDNPPCVNPAHLFVGTTRENFHDMMRKDRWANPSTLKDHCPRGHPYDEQNTYRHQGKRHCRRCRAARAAATRASRSG
jgi:hypothetical protein